MLVGLRAVELLALFTAFGVPLHLVLSAHLRSGHPAPWLLATPEPGRRGTSLLMAPASGFAALVILASWWLASGRPLRDVVGPTWLLLSLVWCAALALGIARRPVRWHVELRPRGWVAAGLVLAGFGVVMGLYLRPFLQDPELVFWHYAGSDGYEYMQVADYLTDAGVRPIPTVGPRDGALGFTALVLDDLARPDGAAEKPGTFAVLSELAALAGVLPHEMFSPLTLAAIGLLYFALVAYGIGLGLSTLSAVCLAGLGCASPAVFLLATNTFLANVLSLHAFPLLLLLWRRPPTWRTAAGSGVFGGVAAWLFPDGIAAMVGMIGLLVALNLWRTRRGAWLRAVVLQAALALVTALVSVAPLARQLAGTALRRFGTVLVSPAQLSAGGVLRPLPSIDWLWPAVNLNVLPPIPLKRDEVPFVVLLATAALVFGAISVANRRTLDLLVSLGGLLGLTVAGVAAGLFASDYDLFRTLAVYAFCPLAALFVVVEWAVARRSLSWQPRLVVPGLALVCSLVLLGHFVLVDRFQFGQAYSEHLADAQYTRTDIADRQAIAEIGASRSVVLASDSPSFTALVNVLMLLSPARPAVPDAFYRFLFFGSVPPQDLRQYSSDLVIANRRYHDIASPGRAVVYASADFLVEQNDLIPFFDNDTFPMLNPLPWAFLATHGLEVGRVLSTPTDVIFFSREERQVRASMLFAPGVRNQKLSMALDDGPTATADLDPSSGSAALSWHVGTGLHRLRLSIAGEAAQVRWLSLEGGE